eukprot:162914-Pelagomonas_calceolata.AAC.1
MRELMLAHKLWLLWITQISHCLVMLNHRYCTLTVFKAGNTYSDVTLSAGSSVPRCAECACAWHRRFS